MKKFWNFSTKLLAAILLSIIIFSGCGTASKQTSVNTGVTQAEDTQTVELTVAAASSLKDALTEIKKVYEESSKNVKVTFSFGASGALQQQIENGADVDIFISAAVKQMDSLEEKGLIIPDTRKNFLENQVVLIVPKDSTLITDFKDLTLDKVRQIGLGEPKGVPVGQYTEEVLSNLKILKQLQKKAVYGNNVKEVLTWVETGNVDAGIVYFTDAKISDKVRIAATAPEGSHKPVYYPAAVIKESKNPEEAKGFTDFLYGSKAKAIFEKYGFTFLI